MTNRELLIVWNEIVADDNPSTDLPSGTPVAEIVEDSSNTLLAHFDADVVEIPIDDHNKLRNRDKENQHPINAITNLTDELNELDTNSIGAATLIEMLNNIFK